MLGRRQVLRTLFLRIREDLKKSKQDPGAFRPGANPRRGKAIFTAGHGSEPWLRTPGRHAFARKRARGLGGNRREEPLAAPSQYDYSFLAIVQTAGGVAGQPFKEIRR